MGRRTDKPGQYGQWSCWFPHIVHCHNNTHSHNDIITYLWPIFNIILYHFPFVDWLLLNIFIPWSVFNVWARVLDAQSSNMLAFHMAIGRWLLIRGKCKKKTEQKLTNVSLYVCMSPVNSEMLVFLCFFPNNAHFSSFLMVAWEKNRRMLLFMGYVCMSGLN